jgi:TnpA family transposase
MARPVDQDELIDRWTLLPEDHALLEGKAPENRLGFALLLKFYTHAARFPRGQSEIPQEAVDYVARQVGVPPGDLGFYEWTGRTIERQRAQIRAELGFRECTVPDAEKLTAWLTEHVAEAERRPELVQEELLARCRAEHIEPPTPGRIERIVASALRQAEETLCQRIASRIPADAVGRIEALVAASEEVAEEAHDDPDRDELPLGFIRADPGNVSLDSMLTEIERLLAVRSVGLPAGLLDDVAPKVVAAWRARAAVEAPSHLRAHAAPLRLTLLAALLVSREREITDALVELLTATVHRIGARADKRVKEELIREFRRVAGKETILFRMAEAALTHPDDTVRTALFPVVPGGEATLQDLVAEYRQSGPIFRRSVQTTLKASYSNHYRRGLIRLLEVLQCRSNNTAHQPVIEALELIRRHGRDANTRYYPLGESIPSHAGVAGDWADLAYRRDSKGRRRVVRTVYEIATFQELRDALRCKEIWVVGADRWRNPDEDLPADFEERRAEHYQALRKPPDPGAFIDEVREEMRRELAALNDALPKLSWLSIQERRSGALRVTPLEAAPEPRNLRRVKKAVLRRWGSVPLVDMLKEAVLRTGCLSVVSSVAGRSGIDQGTLAERLLLAIYAYGTNTGIRAVAAGPHGHSEDDIRYARRRYLTPEAARAIAIEIANATFACRQQPIWGTGSTAVASDSTHVGAFDENIFTEWHSRYGGRGVLIYWHVETGSVVVHSQLINCSASEVAAMVEGAIRHGTSMQLEANIVDSHGQSEIGFGISRLLGFDLLARTKRINKVNLYRPGAGEPDAYPQLRPALTRPIRWDLIASQYDSMIKYATAIRVGTASTEAILRRFTRAATHPTYLAMLELGRAQRTIFVARYLRLREVQREIEEALNVIESWNRVNSVIAYGKGGDIASNHRDEQEMVVLCLRILQAAVVFVNTLMLQDVLADPEWAEVLTEEDRRGLTPLFWLHLLPYGEVRLDMARRLQLSDQAPSPVLTEDRP